MSRWKTPILYLVAYLLAIGSTLRYYEYLSTRPRPWLIGGLLAVFFLLLVLEPWLSRRRPRSAHLYLAAQTCVLLALAPATRIEDVFAIPFMSLTLQAMHLLPPRIGLRWIGAFSLLVAVLVPVLGVCWGEAGLGYTLPNVLVYLTAYLLAGSTLALISELERARERAQGLLSELRSAHHQLQAYAAQAEQAAVAAERQRMARELHDSVTQSLHSSMLLAEAGQRLAEAGDLERTRHYLGRLGEIAQQSLKEMRLLVYELRPLALKDMGLVGALQQRLDAVERRAGIDVILTVPVELELEAHVEEELYRIAEEALNNALKHARPSSVAVTVGHQGDPLGRCVTLEVTDDGAGFNPRAVDGEGGLGLVSMRQRAERVGGRLTIHSVLGEGTTVRVVVGGEASS
jgi:signal transduction histidine kinase